MSGIFVYIKLETWLAQWVIHEMGGNPINFSRKSVEHQILRMSLTKRPENVRADYPGENKVAIELPYFKNMDVRV